MPRQSTPVVHASQTLPQHSSHGGDASGQNTDLRKSSLTEWAALTHVELIHRQGIRAPPMVIELCEEQVSLT